MDTRGQSLDMIEVDRAKEKKGPLQAIKLGVSCEDLFEADVTISISACLPPSRF